eukprot:TRINITY_DN923_c0_g1_i1.p1 TRINITY_DN923_c0_g1~~TRINITY_DN923_c0_g1_i1.p1  ORF type:complete len:191 (+),score=6.99 TRINITY_DN923_c0_g1_i1:2-574(+)
MTCQKASGGCGGEWCWMCRGDWKTHGTHTGGYFSCNKYEKSSGKKMDDEAAKFKAEAEHFAHFFDRYFNHQQNETDATNKKAVVMEKSISYREETGLDPTFIMEALDLLVECRHVLKYTYVYSFFLEKRPHKTSFKELFLYQQANAEGITERLSSELYKAKIDADVLKNLTDVTRRYIRNLVKSFEDDEA